MTPIHRLWRIECFVALGGARTIKHPSACNNWPLVYLRYYTTVLNIRTLLRLIGVILNSSHMTRTTPYRLTALYISPQAKTRFFSVWKHLQWSTGAVPGIHTLKHASDKDGRDLLGQQLLEVVSRPTRLRMIMGDSRHSRPFTKTFAVNDCYLGESRESAWKASVL